MRTPARYQPTPAGPAQPQLGGSVLPQDHRVFRKPRGGMILGLALCGAGQGTAVHELLTTLPGPWGSLWVMDDAFAEQVEAGAAVHLSFDGF